MSDANIAEHAASLRALSDWLIANDHYMKLPDAVAIDPAETAELLMKIVVEARFRRCVERIAAWTDAEVARVSPEQTRYVAQVVRDGADPVYPPFGDHPLPSVALHFGRPARPTR